MLIYLIRHLPTEYNQKGIYMGRSYDMPILLKGIELFTTTVAKMRDIGKNSIIYSSPALRCRQTAKILSDALKIRSKPQISEKFNEMNYGQFEGKSPKKIKIHYPDIYWNWMRHPSLVRFPGGETFIEVQMRAVTYLQKIINREHKQATDNFIFIVTHVDIIKMIICWILNISIDNKRLFCINNGSFTLIETTNEKYNKKKLKVRYINRI